MSTKLFISFLLLVTLLPPVLSYYYHSNSYCCLSVLLEDPPSSQCDMCYLTFREPTEPDPCSAHTRSFDLRSRYSKVDRLMRTAEIKDEDKVIPSLWITGEPPHSLEVMEGGSATLSCTATSAHTETIGYSWEYATSDRIVEAMPDGVETLEENVLTIDNMTRVQVGWYQCKASDGSNRALSRKTKLDLVYFNGTFESEPESATAKSGELIVTLSCSPPSSYPPAIVTWFKGGVEVSDDNALTTPSGDLVIHHVVPDNDGVYHCEAKNEKLGVKSASNTATLTVAGSMMTENHLPQAIWKDAAIYLIEGETVTITCGVYGEDQPNIVWYMGTNRKITDNLVSFSRVTISPDQYKLTIRDVIMSDTASYICIASNSIGADELPIPTALWVVSDLRFSKELTNKVLVKEANFELICEVTSNPPVKVEWYADGQKLVRQKDHVDWDTTIEKIKGGEFATKSVLSVNAATVDDTGLYQCFAVNEHQTAMSSSSVFISSVLEFEEVHFITPDKMYIEDGKSGVVRCGAQGAPIPDVSWIGLSPEYTSTTTEGTAGLSSTREISFPMGPLFLNESGQHTLTCLARNNHAGVDYSKIRDITVIVGYPVQWVNGTWPQVEMKKGESGVLACEFSGTPTPTITWKRNGVSLPFIDDNGETNHVVQKDGALLISKATNSDNTIFTCIGTNGFNSVPQEIQVIVTRGSMSVAEVSGLSVGIIIFICLIILAMLFLYRHTRRKKKVDVAINHNGVDTDTAAKDDFAMGSPGKIDEHPIPIKLHPDLPKLDIPAEDDFAMGSPGKIEQHPIPITFHPDLPDIPAVESNDDFVLKCPENIEEQPIPITFYPDFPMYANCKSAEKLKEEEEAKRLKEERKKAEEERLRKEAEEAERLKREAEEAERLRLEEEERIRKEAAQENARLEAEETARREAEENAKFEAEQLAKREAEEAEEAERLELEEKLRIEAEEKARLEAEEKVRLEAEEKARLEAEEKARLEAEEKARLEAEEKARLEAEEKARLEAEEKARLEAEEKARLEAEEKARLEAEEKARLEAEEKARLEAEEKARLEAEEMARLEAEEKARLEAEENVRLEAEEKARIEAEETARLEAEEKARLEAEEMARLEAEEKARLEAEEKARLEAEEKARIDAEETARLEAEDKARLEAEEKARLEAEEKVRLEAEDKARLEAEEKARLEAEEQAKLEAEEMARLEAEEKARLEAEEKARLEAEEKARLEAEEMARLEAEEKARLEAEEKARLEAEEKARLEAEEKARIEAEEKAKLEQLRIEEMRLKEEEERIAMLQHRESEERRKREEEERLAREQFEQEEAEEAARKAAEKEAAREEAQRQLEEETTLARAREEAALRAQKEVHSKNQDLAEKEFQAAKTAEVEAEASVKESKSSRELEIANRMRDGALVRAQRATINKNLADATVSRDVKLLKPVISKAEKKRVNGTENYLLQAKKLYEQLQAATQLKGATFDRRIADIEAAIHAIKKGGFETLLAVELLEAQVLLKKLKRIQKAALEVQKLSQQTIAILKSYNRPPDVVTQVMRSVFLLLGNKSSELQTWPDIVIQLNKIGKNNTKRRIQCCVPENIEYVAAKKVELILCKYDEELVFDTTQALGVFYNWAECIADERLALPEVLTEKHKSSGLFGAARPPPLPQGGIVASGTPPKKKKTKAPDTKGKKKKKGGDSATPNGGLRVGADKAMPPPPKFLFNDR